MHKKRWTIVGIIVVIILLAGWWHILEYESFGSEKGSGEHLPLSKCF
jgi:hypothetical protein